MPLGHKLLMVAGLIVMATILAGLVARRLYRLCYCFPAYLLVVAIGDFLILAWPESFYQWNFFQAKETLYAALKFAIALELAALAFQAFPGAKHRARQLALAILALILVAMLGSSPAATDMPSLALELQPRLINGTALLFAAVWALILWYHIPMHRLHRALLRGFVPYLLIFTVALRLIGTFGWQRLWVVADGAAYMAMLLYWAWEVWREQAQPDVDARLLHRLQPWRDRL